MLEEDVESIVVDELKIEFKTEEQFSLNIENGWDDPEGPFFKWLKDIGNEGLIKTKSAVHNATRTKFLKEWLAEKKPLPDFIDLKYWNRIKYNQAEIGRRVINDSKGTE